MPAYVNGKPYNLEDPEQKKAYQRDYHREYVIRNRDKIHQLNKRYYDRHANDPEFKKKRNEAYKKRFDSNPDKIREQARIRSKKKYAVPEYRAKRLKEMKDKYANDPQFREDRLNRYKNRYHNDEEFRKKQNEYTKAYTKKKRAEEALRKSVK